MASYVSLPKIELHNHIDGACRLESLMDMCRKDNLDIKRFPYDNPDEFRKRVTLEGPQQSLVDFLKPFTEVNFILSSPDNLRRQCIEFCEDQKKHNVIYTESRICPFLYIGRDLFTPEGVVQTVLDAFKEGEALYDIKIRLILCFLRPYPEWSPEIARLAIKYKDQGVVGIDIAGDELAPIDGHLESFKVAYEAGMNITAHAGESGPAANVTQAIKELKATRIGHGYHVVDDDSVYQLAKQTNVHFEVCLTSSIYTNSCTYGDHPAKRFVKDKVNFGLNTDDSSIIGITISSECGVAVKEINMTLDQVIETMFNAGRSCFLPDEEKASLLAKLAVLVAQYKENLSC